MIVRPHPKGWKICLHPAHGVLAARLFEQLHDPPEGDLALPSLLAVAEHDDHQLDFNTGDYLTEAGAPVDFTLIATSDKQRSIQSEQLLKEAYRKHAWTYLLIGMHYEYLYAGQEVDKRLQLILEDVKGKRKEILHRRSWTADLLDRTYGQLRFCDRLSLLLCGNDIPALGRAVEINDGLGEPAFLTQDPETQLLNIDPWPFALTAFTVSAECFLLTRLSFPSSKVLGEAVGSAVASAVSWQFGRSK